MKEGLRWFATVVAFTVLGCSSKKPVATRTPDAAAPTPASATAPAPPLPYRADVLARERFPFPTFFRFDDGLLFDAGLFLYRIDDDGRLTRLGEPAAYVNMLPENADLVGYDAVQAGASLSGLRGSAARPYAIVEHGRDTEKDFLWDGHAFVPATPPADLPIAHRYFHGGDKPVGSPPEIYWREQKSIGRGRSAWLGRAQEDEELIGIVQDGKLTVTHPLRVFVGQKPHGACTLLPSADGHAYATCDLFEGGPGAKRVRLDGETWAFAFPNVKRSLNRDEAIDAEGALWSFETPVKVVRKLPDGAETTFELALEGAPRAPGYKTGVTATQASLADFMNVRRYVTARVDADDAPLKPDAVREIEAMPDGSIYAIVGMSYSSAAVVRFARRAPAPAPLAIGGPADQVLEARNAQALRSWAGVCPQVFVRMPSSVPEEVGRRALKEATDRFAKLDEGKRPQAALVEARLARAKVRGLVFLRPDPLVRENDLDAAVTAAIRTFTANPADAATATCTLPAIDRVLAATAAPDVYDGD